MKLKLLRFLCITIILFITGCAGIRGYGESERINYSDVCVIENAKVTVPLFEQDLVTQLENRQLKVKVVEDKSQCELPMALTYTALRSMGVVTKIKLSLYENDLKVAYIDWDAGRSPMPAKISDKTFNTVEFWQTAEALAGLFGEIQIK